jgi:hypothetical protein
MRLDFSEVQDGESFVSIPEGVYLCRVDEVRTGLSRDGSERWSFKLVVADGEYAGRVAAWDNLTWSERGVVRVKRVLAAFGYDVTGVVELDSHDLVGRKVRAQVVGEVWEDPKTGMRRERLAVPFIGYDPADDAVANGAPRATDGQPF